jgi:hypothetical protein
MSLNCPQSPVRLLNLPQAFSHDRALFPLSHPHHTLVRNGQWQPAHGDAKGNLLLTASPSVGLVADDRHRKVISARSTGSMRKHPVPSVTAYAEAMRQTARRISPRLGSAVRDEEDRQLSISDAA